MYKSQSSLPCRLARGVHCGGVEARGLVELRRVELTCGGDWSTDGHGSRRGDERLARELAGPWPHLFATPLPGADLKAFAR